MTMATDKLKVFVSYSRADTKFADELVAGLEFDGGFDILIDRHSIEKGEDWKARLGALIEAADTVVFVLSPASATSDICRWEVEYAANLNKRILPVLHLPLGDTTAPPALGRINYVDFTTAPTLISGIRDLATTLRTDLNWLREATRLLNLALDWERAGKRDNRLLSGPDIVEAKKWLADCPASETPTELHRDYIRASEQAEALRLDADRQRLAELAAAQQQAATAAERIAGRTRLGLAAALLLASLAGWFGWIMYGQWLEGLAGESRFLADLARQAVRDDDPVTGRLLALEALPDETSERFAQRLRPWLPEAEFALDAADRPGQWHDRVLAGHEGVVGVVAWSPDGTRVLTGSRDGTARLWEASSGRELARLEGHTHWVPAVAWSPDGTRVLTGSGDRTARLWEASSGRELARLEGHTEAVTEVAWSPDGTRLLTGAGSISGEDNTARLWEAPPPIQQQVERQQQRLSRCLTAAQRRRYHLAPAAPRWCYATRSWPWHDRIPLAAWHERPLSVVRATLVAWLPADSAPARWLDAQDWLSSAAELFARGDARMAEAKVEAKKKAEKGKEADRQQRLAALYAEAATLYRRASVRAPEWNANIAPNIERAERAAARALKEAAKAAEKTAGEANRKLESATASATPAEKAPESDR